MFTFKPLSFKGLDNTRDLGGFPAAGGKSIRPKTLLRSAELGPAAKKDIRILETKYHLAVIADFRSEAERRAVPDPEIPGAKNVVIEVLDNEAIGISREQKGLTGLYEKMRDPGFSTLEYFTPFYRALVSGETARRGYAEFFRLLLELQPGAAALWHCTAGKDRAGMATVYLLLALGTPREVIEADYMSQNEYRRDMIEALAKRFGRGIPYLEANVRDLYSADPDYLGTAFEEMERFAGSPGAYLEKGLGLDAEKIALLREKFLV